MDRQSAYTKLLQRHRSMVWRMCWVGSHGHWDRCCDLVQEVSIVLWLRFKNLRTGVSQREERAWVYWQVRSVLDLQHRRRRVSLLPLNDDLADTIADEDRWEFKEQIDDLLASLSADEQRMLRLQMEGYQADEIATLMGLTRDTVYQRMHRAVVKMRRVALLGLIVCLVATVAVAVVPQWRVTVFHQEEDVEDASVEQEPLSPAPSSTLPDTLRVAADTAAAPSARIPLEPLSHLVLAVDTTLPALPSHLPDVRIAVEGNKIILSRLLEGEVVRVRNLKGVLVALKRGHSGSCTIELPAELVNGLYTTPYILQIGSRPDVIRIEM